MEKKKFEVPVLKICRFDCKDVIATSEDPITPPPTGGDFGPGQGAAWTKARTAPVSWD